METVNGNKRKFKAFINNNRLFFFFPIFKDFFNGYKTWLLSKDCNQQSMYMTLTFEYHIIVIMSKRIKVSVLVFFI